MTTVNKNFFYFKFLHSFISQDDPNNFDKDDSNSSVTGKGISPSGIHGSSASSTSTNSSSSQPQHQTAIDIQLLILLESYLLEML